MNLLAIDTATEACSAALLTTNDSIIHRQKILHRQHANLILPMIDEIIATSDISLTQLNAIAFTNGPGSFTGIRIGTGVVQGIAFALDLPVIPISTLAALAQSAAKQFAAQYILPAIDARMQQIYWGAYQTDKTGLVHKIADDQLVDPDKVTINSMNKPWLGAGSGWQEYNDTLKNRLADYQITIQPQIFPLAKDLLLLAKERLQLSETVAVDKALPVYLRDKVVN